MAAVKYLDENGLSTVWSKVKGIVTPKADKVSGATAGHLAGLNSSGNLTDSGLPASNVAQKDGSYSGMTVGAAEDLVSAESVASEFTYRVTGGSTAVGKGGTALVDKIKGRTVVWNQLVQQSYGSTVTPNEVTISVASDGKFTLSGTASASGGRTSYVSSSTNMIPIISGHKYISVNGAPSTLSPYVTLPSSPSTVLLVPNGIITASTTFEGRLGFNVTKDINYDGVSFYLSLIDLTLMFGAGNEPSTPEEFEALYPGPYYDYNPGTLISNAATAIETVGWNIWDEEWEVGSINDSSGNNESNATIFRTKNFIPVIPSKVYYIKRSDYSDNARLRLFQYDKNYTYLGSPTNVNNTTITVGSSTYYIRFRSVASGAVYDNDICVSLSDPSRNGTYEPYWRSELDLNIPTLTGKLNGTGNSVVIFPDGLRSAGTVYDEIVGNKAIKRIGAVDMGSLTWNRESTYERFLAPVDGIRPAISNSTPSNMVCAKYKLIDLNAMLASQPDKTLAGTATNTNICILDSAYTDAATFKASLSGVTLYYELATPEEYILDETIPTAMRNDPYGTERRLPEDTAAIVTAPFRADITYSTNIKEAVQSLPQNYININSMQDFLAALGTLMGGTWTMRPADGKFDFTFTPNPSNE